MRNEYAQKILDNHFAGQFTFLENPKRRPGLTRLHGKARFKINTGDLNTRTVRQTTLDGCILPVYGQCRGWDIQWLAEPVSPALNALSRGFMGRCIDKARVVSRQYRALQVTQPRQIQLQCRQAER